MTNHDPFNLNRFLDAQAGVYECVLHELRQGRKRTHWMWFVFPQLAGLGYSEMARTFAISSVDEAREYLKHPILGARLQECTALVNKISDASVDKIFGYPDDLKFRSCMTLFAEAAGAVDSVFHEALLKFFQGEPDPETQRLMNDL